MDSLAVQAIAPQTITDDIFGALLERIGDARIVLIGEATHGTHEFYRLRAELTKMLIADHGFGAVACEADWPDARRVDRYVRGARADADATAALGDFERFPQWMWRNEVVRDFATWLRATGNAGFYGLDVYSMHRSIARVIEHLELRGDAAAAKRARERYACFDSSRGDPQRYGRLVSMGLAHECEDAVVAELVELLRRSDADREAFDAAQNARVVANAEEYYREMYSGGVSTWNLRDTHMADTLDALLLHLGTKIVVWAHNSHCGDSDAMTHRAERDEITLGHLCRVRHPDDTVLIGMTTFDGTVSAASDWDQEVELKRVRPALPGSYEALFHQIGQATGVHDFAVVMDRMGEAAAAVLHEHRLERAIGVIYRPESERASHYFDVRLADQFDAVVHVERTRALVPLAAPPAWHAPEDLPDTFPTGL